MHLIVNLDTVPIEFWHCEFPGQPENHSSAISSRRGIAQLCKPWTLPTGGVGIDGLMTTLLPQCKICISEFYSLRAIPNGVASEKERDHSARQSDSDPLGHAAHEPLVSCIQCPLEQ